MKHQSIHTAVPAHDAAPHRQRVLFALYQALDGLQPLARQIYLSVFEQTLAQAEANRLCNPLGMSLKVTLQDLFPADCNLDDRQCLAWVERMRLSPAMLPVEGSALTRADGAEVPLLDIIRILIHDNDQVETAWWIRAGLWSHWNLSDEDRYFVLRCMAAARHVSSGAAEQLQRKICLGLSQMFEEGWAPVSWGPPLDLILKRHGVSPEDLRSPMMLEAVHGLEEVGLLGSWGDGPAGKMTDEKDFAPEGELATKTYDGV